MNEVRVATPCPSCPRHWDTEVAYDLMRDEWEVRMRHGSHASRCAVSGEAKRSAGADVMAMAVQRCTSEIARAERCLEYAPPRTRWIEAPPWVTVSPAAGPA